MVFVQTHRHYYCGVDLHSKSHVLCVLRQDGKRILRRKIANRADLFLKAIAPFRHSLAVAVESTFNWYWFVDMCRENGIEIHMGHAYYMKAISAGKTKNDRLDAEKIANLLRAGLLPFSYACHAEKRSVRNLLRRRNYLVYQRSALLGHTTMRFYQEGLVDFQPRQIKNKGSRFPVLEELPDENVRVGAQIDMGLVTHLDQAITQLERHILKQAGSQFRREMDLIREIPGIGPIISLSIVYETDDIGRFKSRQRFSSYARMVSPTHISNGKITSRGKRKCGNPYLKWAMMEIVSNAPSYSKEIGQIYNNLKLRYHPLKARAILANHFCTAIYFILKHKKHFNVDRFCKSFAGMDSQMSETGAMRKAA